MTASDKENIDESGSTGEKHRTSASISAPWGAECNQTIDAAARIFGSQNVVNAPSEDIIKFVTERSRVHEVYIVENAKNKRIGLILSFVLILAASAVVIFAPEGRQTLSYWVGAALLVFAAGASGFARVWGKLENFSVGADQGRGPRD